MKKIISLFLALLAVVSVLSVSASVLAASKKAPKTEIDFVVRGEYEVINAAERNFKNDTCSYRVHMEATDTVYYLSSTKKAKKPDVRFVNKNGSIIELDKKYYKITARKYKKPGKYSIKVTLTNNGKKLYTFSGKKSKKKSYFVRPHSIHSANIYYNQKSNSLAVSANKPSGATHIEVTCKETSKKNKDKEYINTYVVKSGRVTVPLKAPVSDKDEYNTEITVRAYTQKDKYNLYSPCTFIANVKY